MKVNADAMTRAVDHRDAAVRLYLAYGPDEAAGQALAVRLAKALGTDVERVELDGDQLKRDPALLADEAAAMSLFGAARVIRVRGGDECASAVGALLDAPRVGNPVILTAGALKPTSALLKTALNHPAVRACQYFKPEGNDAVSLVMAAARGVGLRMARPVAARLAATTNGERGLIDREVEKLATFLDAAPDRPRDASDDVLDALGAGIDEGGIGPIVNAIVGGTPATLGHDLDVMRSTGTTIPTLRAIAARLLLLMRIRAAVDDGASLATAFDRHGKGVFWRDKDAVIAQAGQWDSRRLRAALGHVFDTEAAIKRAGTAGDVIASERLVGIARAAGRRR